MVFGKTIAVYSFAICKGPTGIKPGEVDAIMETLNKIGPRRTGVFCSNPVNGLAKEVGIRLGVSVTEIQTDEYNGYGANPIAWREAYFKYLINDLEKIVVIDTSEISAHVIRAFSPVKKGCQARGWADDLNLEAGTYAVLTRFSRVSKRGARYVGPVPFCTFSSNTSVLNEKAVF